MKKSNVHATAWGYKGPKRFYVTAPGHKTIVVAAPDESSAIAVCGEFWGERWQAIDFYTNCIVTRERKP